MNNWEMGMNVNKVAAVVLVCSMAALSGCASWKKGDPSAMRSTVPETVTMKTASAAPADKGARPPGDVHPAQTAK